MSVNRPVAESVSAHVVDCAVYVSGKRLPGRWSYADAIAEVRRRDNGFVWIGLHEPDAEQIHVVAETFGLHESTVKDAVCAHQRSKLHSSDDTLLMVLKTVHYVEHESPATANEIVDTGQILTFLGPDFILTVRHGQHSGLRDLREELEAAPERLQAGPSAVLHGIADRVVDSYLEVTEAFERDIDEVESVVFLPRSPISAEQMYFMKREIVELRRAVVPLAVPLRRLAYGETAMVPTEVQSYFRDVEDHLITVSERVAGFDELLTTLLDATVAKVSLQQNTDVRKISSWIAILSVPTMVVGVYGMNFDHMPELHWTFGYPLVITVILGVCLVLHRVLKHNQWL